MSKKAMKAPDRPTSKMSKAAAVPKWVKDKQVNADCVNFNDCLFSLVRCGLCCGSDCFSHLSRAIGRTYPVLRKFVISLSSYPVSHVKDEITPLFMRMNRIDLLMIILRCYNHLIRPHVVTWHMTTLRLLFTTENFQEQSFQIIFKLYAHFGSISFSLFVRRCTCLVTQLAMWKTVIWFRQLKHFLIEMVGEFRVFSKFYLSISFS